MKESAFYNINLNRKREQDESYDDYKERLKEIKDRMSLHIKGKKVWNSYRLGTYVRAVHGSL
jgi:hypothetical protein|tara:strand:- start:2274 stop:2459 length:186 start_codon:yes stop_codon:yes gene_type:complete